MAEISGAAGGLQRKHRLHRSKKPVPKVDMTPMVDLGFLLITFFMLSMQMAKPGAMEWDKRIKDITDEEPVPECCALNILIDSANRVYTYEGEDIKSIQPTSFDDENGLTQVIMRKGKKVKTACGLTHAGKPRELICLIKLLPGSRYQNLTDVVDEMNITHTHYSIQEPLPEEVAQLKIKEKELAGL